MQDYWFQQQKLETGNWKLETGDWKLKTRNWKLEFENWKLEYGNENWKLEIAIQPGYARKPSAAARTDFEILHYCK